MEHSPEKTAQDLDIDFENFTVQADRAQNIRTSVERLKTSGWIDQWRLLLTELGRDETPQNESTPQLPGITADSTVRIYRVENTEHPANGLVLAQQGGDLKVFRNDKVLVELTALPKEDEFAVFYLNEEAMPELDEIMTAVEGDIKHARSQKSSRGSVWKERFSKS